MRLPLQSNDWGVPLPSVAGVRLRMSAGHLPQVAKRPNPILLALSTERLTLGRIPGHATRDGVELRSFGFLTSKIVQPSL